MIVRPRLFAIGILCIIGAGVGCDDTADVGTIDLALWQVPIDTPTGELYGLDDATLIELQAVTSVAHNTSRFARGDSLRIEGQAFKAGGDVVRIIVQTFLDGEQLALARSWRTLSLDKASVTLPTFLAAADQLSVLDVDVSSSTESTRPVVCPDEVGRLHIWSALQTSTEHAVIDRMGMASSSSRISVDEHRLRTPLSCVGSPEGGLLSAGCDDDDSWLGLWRYGGDGEHLVRVDDEKLRAAVTDCHVSVVNAADQIWLWSGAAAVAVDNRGAWISTTTTAVSRRAPNLTVTDEGLFISGGVDTDGQPVAGVVSVDNNGGVEESDGQIEIRATDAIGRDLALTSTGTWHTFSSSLPQTLQSPQQWLPPGSEVLAFGSIGAKSYIALVVDDDGTALHYVDEDKVRYFRRHMPRQQANLAVVDASTVLLVGGESDNMEIWVPKELEGW